MPVAVLYWARIEAYYRDIPDLLVLPARKFCNLVLHWMMEHTDGEVWDREYKQVFFPDPGTLPQQASKAKLAEAEPGKEGSLNIERKAEPIKVSNDDLAKFLGRAGGTGKPDQNKSLIRQKQAAKRPATRTIGPDPDGNLTVQAPDQP